MPRNPGLDPIRSIVATITENTMTLAANANAARDLVAGTLIPQIAEMTGIGISTMAEMLGLNAGGVTSAQTTALETASSVTQDIALYMIGIDAAHRSLERPTDHLLVGEAIGALISAGNALGRAKTETEGTVTACNQLGGLAKQLVEECQAVGKTLEKLQASSEAVDMQHSQTQSHVAAALELLGQASSFLIQATQD